MERQGQQAMVQDERKGFTTKDREVVAWVRYQNMQGYHDLVWEWVAPDGSIYHRTEPLRIGAREGRLRPASTAWHHLPIAGAPPTRQPGDWQVRLLLDGKLASERYFSLSRLIDPNDPIARQTPPDARKYALIVGIEDYVRLPKAIHAGNDAEVVRRYLHEVVGVPQGQIDILRDNEATRATLTGYLREEAPRKLGADAIFYLYFAGHGMPDLDAQEQSKPAYVMPYDGNPKAIKSTGYAIDALYADVEALPVARAFVFTDACFSGAARDRQPLTPDARPALIRVRQPEPRTRLQKTHILSASDMNEIARGHPDSSHGLFTHYLLLGLRGESDADGNGQVSLAELYDYTRNQVSAMAKARLGSNQTPQLFPQSTAGARVIVNPVLEVD